MTMFNQIGLMIAEHLSVLRWVIIGMGLVLCLVPVPRKQKTGGDL